MSDRDGWHSDDDATTLAAKIRSGHLTARDSVGRALAAVRDRDTALNCFTSVLKDSAIAQADVVDKRIARGEDPGPLAGVPFAVKNLFDIRGVTTLAGVENPGHEPSGGSRCNRR